MPHLPHPTPRQSLVLLCLALFLYATMVLGTLAQLEQISGLRPFDLRPTGYTQAQAQALLSALGAEGRHIYLTRQLPLDMGYPALIALAIAGGLAWAAPGWARWGVPLAYAAALADYAENTGIAMMLVAGEDLSTGLVLAASLATLTKSILQTLAFTAVLFALIRRAWRLS